MCALPVSVHAVNSKDKVLAPKTKLEQFSTRTGMVIVQGYEEIGLIVGLNDTFVRVIAKEFAYANSGKKEHGIQIEVIEKKGRYDKERRSFVDYNEIESLINSIEYILKVNKSVTKFRSFEVDYITKGGLEVSTFSTISLGAPPIQAAITSGKIGGITLICSIEELSNFCNLIKMAKKKIDTSK